MSSLTIQNLFSVAGKIALVTGGSRGIGEMIARAYVENGAKVYISSRKAQACEALAQALSQHGTCIALPADIAQFSEIERLADHIAEREGRLDILVNNAGVTWGQLLDSFPETGWDKVMDVNVKSLFFLTQKLLPCLEAAASDTSWSRVINIGSIEGLHVSHGLEAFSYSASKAAVLHLTRVLAWHTARRKIAVNAIAPGYFPSKMTAGIEESLGEKTRAATPMRRFGTPEDMAGAALYLASRASGFVTGATLVVDGGLETTS
jgi:NAD(P)-dependent dehydrogenase (short-subunit alcohol dehydrogenase family)